MGTAEKALVILLRLNAVILLAALFPVVAAALYDERLDALLGANRFQGGLNVVQRTHATSAVLRALRRGEVVGLLVDQDTRVPGTFVRFFNHPAHTPVGPAVIAGRTGAPIVPMGIRFCAAC